MTTATPRATQDPTIATSEAAPAAPQEALERVEGRDDLVSAIWPFPASPAAAAARAVTCPDTQSQTLAELKQIGVLS